MIDTKPTSAEGGNELALAAYNQNFETFRSLNTLMWQIPLIAMTLTGGLWFGVTSIESSPITFRICLLLLAGAGNLGLVVILRRLRYIMGRYLEWLEEVNPAGFVSADGSSFFTKRQTMRDIVQALLLLAAALSFVLVAISFRTYTSTESDMTNSTAWYDKNAEQVAVEYEALRAADVHPGLFASIEGSKALRILDIGSGSGRDAAALTSLGHRVVAVEPSVSMLRIAKELHADADIIWKDGSLPDLSDIDGEFDLILLSAVWMHVQPDQRSRALERLVSLLAPGGKLHITLRSEHMDPARGMFASSVNEIKQLALARSLAFAEAPVRSDLLGRAEVTWREITIARY